MTKEQEEAIEKLEYISRYYYYNNHYSRYELDCIETVLNMLKVKDKEIEHKNIVISEKNKELADNYTLLTMKDRQIDLIAEKLAKAYHYTLNKCTLKEREKDNIDCDKYRDCASCVKQYFESQVEEC